MEYTDKEYCLEVWGDWACFTRPEFKAERVSYDVITPSAIRAIFESIFWKPAIRWQPTKVEVLNPIKWINIRRNELGTTATCNASTTNCVYIEKERQQRNSVLLRDVRYRIYAKLVFIPNRNRLKEQQGDKDENPGKYQGMFERRAKKGQCFYQPYLGTRECTAHFMLTDASQATSPAISETRDLGIMQYDVDYTDGKNRKFMFFRAKMQEGIILIPDINSNDILR